LVASDGGSKTPSTFLVTCKINELKNRLDKSIPL